MAGYDMKMLLDEHEKWLNDPESGKKFEYHGDLSFVSLFGANLRGADLFGVNLSDANLYCANMNNTKF